MIRATMSATELLARCSYWNGPEVPWVANDANEESDGGTLVHEALAAALPKRAGAIPTDDATLRAMFAHGLAWLKRHATASMRAEVPFAYDVRRDSARELPSTGQRDYSQRTTDEFCGTADLVALGHDDEGPLVVVADWKCHFGAPERKDARAQLQALGLAAARTYGVTRARCVALHLDERGVDDESERYELDAFDLALVAVALDEATRAPSKPKPGPWCEDRYCPARAACPVTTAAIANVMPATALVRGHRLSTQIADPEHAAWSLVAVDLVEEALKHVKASLRAYADATGGIPTGDGKVWAAKEVVTEKPDLSVVGAVDELRAMGLEAAIERSTTWAAIARAGGEEAEERARAALRAMGATKTTTHVRYEARRPRKGRAA